MNELNPQHLLELALQIKQWGQALGFQQVGITDTDLSVAEVHLQDWLANNYHGEMDYMQRHGLKRSRPALLHEGTVRVISVRMDYQTESAVTMNQALESPTSAYISRYAVGRDYHKMLRNRLQKLADKIQTETSLIAIDLPLPVDSPTSSHCGDCVACLDICPTQAIVAPYQVDARRCVSYLTIELHGSIPEPYRKLIGNRIYGCDDCQIICPWNRFAKLTAEADFNPRQQLNTQQLLDVFAWTEEIFLAKTEGSAIRRIGHDRWLRNIAVALGNAPLSALIIEALKTKLNHPSEMVREHVQWALAQHLS
jgi:epoxyqueuosine reductase